MKNIYLQGNICRVVSLFIFSAILNGCNRNSNNPGWDYFPDMFYSTAYETFSKNPNFRDGMTNRLPVEGTVPRDITPFDYTPDPESRIKAGLELTNPVLSTPETIARGKIVYTIFCIGCHGISGAGDGYLFTSGLYPFKPLSISGNTAAKLKDGEIFHTITLGLRLMGAHGGQIRPEDRWKLVIYIRSLQEEASGTSNTGKGK